MSCSTCGQAASLLCNHVEVDGSASVTRYCSKGCQVADWPNHKEKCNSSKYRKQLYTAGRLLQEVFYLLREESFEQLYDDIADDADGRLHIFDSVPDPDKFLFRFPSDIDLSLLEKQTILCHLHAMTLRMCIYTRLYEQTVMVEASRSRIVVHKANGAGVGGIFNHQVFALELKDGNEYIIDFAGAQYGQYQSVMPKAAFYAWLGPAGFPQSRKLGSLREARRQFLEKSDVCNMRPDKRGVVVQGKIAAKLEVLVADWEQGAGTTIEDLTRKETSIAAHTISQLLDFLRSGLKVFIEQSETDGSFEFERLSGYDQPTFKLR